MNASNQRPSAITWCRRIKNKWLRKLCINVSLLIGGSKESMKAILFGFLIGSVILLILGYQPLLAYKYIFEGAFVGTYSITETLVISTPLILSALSYAIAYRCGVINLGAEGQIYMGALASGVVAIYVTGLPTAITMTLAIIAGAVAGGLWGLLAAWLKVKFGASELITTIMLNYIAIHFVGTLLNGTLRAEGSVEPHSEFIPKELRLPRLFDDYRLNIAFLIALTAIAFYFFFLWKTTIGYETRVVGKNKHAAEYAGIKVRNRALLSMIIAGAFAGLAGVSEVMGVQFRVYSNLSSGLGFDGIAIALVGANAPLGILFSGIFFGALRSGAGLMQVMVQTPVSLVDMLMAIIIILITAPRLFVWVKEKLRISKLLKGGEQG